MAGPKNLGGKTKEIAEEAKELASVAQQMAMSQIVSTSVQAVMLEAIIRILVEKNLLNKRDLENLFYHCYALMVQNAQGTRIADDPVFKGMLEICTKVARAFDVDLETLVRMQPPQRN